MIVDALGRSHRFQEEPARVVSLVPSLTETLFDLGAGDAVIGVTDFCVFPEAAAARAIVGGTKTPDLALIRELRPDLVHMNLEENLERHASAIEEFAPVFVSEPKSVDDVISLLLALGAIHRRATQAELWAAQIEGELSEMEGEPFTFACPIWKNPWMWCGGDTYVSNLVATAGGLSILHERARYPSIEAESVLAMGPNVIFLPDEPYAFTEEDAAELRARSRSRVIGPFPGHLFTWHGTRTIEGLRFLRRALAEAKSLES